MRLGWDVLPLLTSRADIGCAGWTMSLAAMGPCLVHLMGGC